jgi:imidazolonepropionase-like amidohydrolase
MKNSSVLWLVPLLLIQFWAPLTATPQLQHLVLTHVTVIDATGAQARPEMTVIITGSRIAALGKADEVRLPEGAQIVDAGGRFVIPGLWDMHIHSGSYEEGKKVFPLLIARGITGVRDMGCPPEDAIRLRRETSEGKILGPRMIVAGPLIQGPLPFQMPLIVSVHNKVEASRAVANLKGQGVDFIKVQDALPRDLYFAVASEAKRQGLQLAGHVPPSITALEATKAGQRSIEHLGGRFQGVLLACSDREAELTKKIRAILSDALRALSEKRGPDDSDIFRASFTMPLLNSYSDRKAAALFSEFKKRQTWQTPTLVAQPIREALGSGRKDLSEDDIRYGRMLMRKQLEIVAAMKRAGVGVTAGTDLPLGGWSLHEELSLFVEAGLTPLEALQTATRNPAEFLGRLDSLGTIEEGKIADLVLLEANPLEDIRNTRKIYAVILGGKMIQKSSLSEIEK